MFCLVLAIRVTRGRRVLENRSTADDEKIEQLESMLKLATDHTNEAETKFDEVGLHCRQSVPSRPGPTRFAHQVFRPVSRKICAAV